MLPKLGIAEIFIIPVLIAWIWTIIDCVRDKDRSGTQKALWVLALLFLNVLAVLVYWVLKLVAKNEPKKPAITNQTSAPR